MGKHTEDGTTMEKSNPHRKWVKILNVLDYHRWNYVKKKMLPHKKHAQGRDGYEEIDAGDEKANVGVKVHVCNEDACTLNFKSPQPEEKVTKEPVRKGCATRIREKISKEVLKKRLRHRRSSTSSPTSSTIENVSRLNSQLINEQEASHKRTLHTERSLPIINIILEDLDEIHDTPSTTKSADVVNDDDDDDDDKESSDEEEPFPMKINMEHLGKSATFNQSKEVMDVLSMNKDFFLKVLQDPNASLERHFMVQRASGKSMLLDKSRTFPRPCPQEQNELASKPNGKPKLDEISRKSFGHVPKVEVASKSFKDLREKIKHVIKEETHRIAMDSVLHRVPYGQHCSESKKDAVEQLSFEMEKDKKQSYDHSVNRWPSLNESMERYCQLIETSFANKPKNICSTSSMNLRVKDANDSQPLGILGRISSSPDLFMCLRSPLEELATPSILPKGIPLPRRPVRASRSFNELDTQNMLSCLGTGDEAEETDTYSVSSIVDDDSVSKSPTMRLEQSSPDITEESESSIKPILAEENITDQEKPESEPEAKLSHHVRVESKDQEQFEYVKEVLQLSGYLENQALGAWQSQNQPIESSLFAELEGWSFQEPDSSEPEETTRCNRLLLFDSINEVLLSTYERSMAYWRSPLTSCSYIHPMPKGYRVLEMVWTQMSWYLNSSANQLESTLDQVLMHDLGEDDGWMNLQFDAEGTAIELECLIFEDILMELIMPIQ